MSMEPKETKKTVRIFALASFLNDLGSDIIYPIWPMFVTSVLGANMAVLGLLDGLGEALVSLSQAASGYVSDRIRKRKVFVWIGYLCGGASRIGYSISGIWQHLIPFRILDRAGKIRSAPRDAIVADISTKENRGYNFGLLRAMDNFGAVCGIVVSIVFLNILGYRKLFLLAAIPSLIGALIIFLFIKEQKVSDTKIYKGLTVKHLDRNFRLFLFLNAIFALGSFSYSFLLIYAKKCGFSIAAVPVLYLLFTIFAAIFSLPFGRLSDRIGRKAVLVVAYSLWIAVCLIAIFSKAHTAIVLVFVLYGLHKAALEPVQKTFVSELAPQDYKASSLGAFQMVIGLSALPASLIAGLLWDKVSIVSPFYLSLTLTIISLIFLIFVKEAKTKK
ncbi:MAG: hypothetical protein A2Y00_10150 [Omnitrophica WOR_2 bacterium GWF2_43_52]|nr:MAG: hypothetical protein A2Y01_02465 [Omnitrophica WOR_2 bacterium GWC2_44_8]OGX21591.1 MAG: hypothetical protein A2Y00_10150 [Omnitrophica WOR_2 bacterium GWF2_43_52]OGX59128.1 MAG: hypothetical protein A2460_09530 [Omnitrophica WOR_2 bacterium RIFOXYC2_FULL_43_9]HAH19478.1 MFS transporter [Candidatus Omnitrophota bacterium]HBG63849.1 MFS transporter [Candidatus Omnitrophota bacterium]